jgi:DNA-binding LacI/PurR family transcriptional regulator
MPAKNVSNAATLHDVAKLAGVSYQTVSRVVNRMPNVSPHTLEKVKLAIATLNYSPNRAARSLVTGKSNTIHLLLCDKFNFRIVPAIEEAAYEQGYQLQFTALHETYLMAELHKKITEIVSMQVGGLVVVMPWSGISYQDLLNLVSDTPVVVVGSSMGHETNSTIIDQAHGIRLAMQHLLDLGHRQFAEIGGPIDKDDDARIRHKTYLETLSQNGIAPGPLECGDGTMRTGLDAMNRLLESRQPFTALVCFNDAMALGAMHAAHKAGINIPQELSVVGFDNDNYASYCIPSLTTVQQDYGALGSNAIQQLISLIQSPQSAPYQRVIFPKLIVRESTAPPPAR